MIAKRYGTKIQSVTPNFDARAMNEIGFQRDNEWSLPADEFADALAMSGCLTPQDVSRLLVAPAPWA